MATKMVRKQESNHAQSCGGWGEKNKQTNMKEKDDYIWKKKHKQSNFLKRNKVKTEAVLYIKHIKCKILGFFFFSKKKYLTCKKFLSSKKKNLFK